MDLALSEILPHRTPMILLDGVVGHDENKLTAVVRITPASYGFEKNGVPAWYGIEYMAQAIAAFNGLNFSKRGEPEIGFLVGVRNYNTSVPEFSLGSELEIFIEVSFLGENSGSFSCVIKSGGKKLAEAALTTYKPKRDYILKIKGDINEQE